MQLARYVAAMVLLEFIVGHVVLAGVVEGLLARDFYRLVVVFREPLDGDAWSVYVAFSGPGAGVNCSGQLRPNLYYLQTKTISRGLVVAPLYYVLSSICPRVLSELQLLAGSRGDELLVVELEAPQGYSVRSGMDWRGFGKAGGPYTLPLSAFVRYYVFDGVVVAGEEYRVVDDSALNLTVVALQASKETVEYTVESLVAVRDAVAEWLGPSPRSPVVLVVAGPGEHQYLPPGTAHSMGGVVYVKLGVVENLPWLVHTVAHEALHGWFNHGMLYGDFSFQEAAAEFLAVKALHDQRPSLYELAASYLEYMLAVDEQYAVWMRVNAALWHAGLRACGEDLYMYAVRELYNRVITDGFSGPVSLLDVASLMVEKASTQCREALEAMIGWVLLAPRSGTSEWPYIDTGSYNAGAGTSAIDSLGTHVEPVVPYNATLPGMEQSEAGSGESGAAQSQTGARALHPAGQPEPTPGACGGSGSPTYWLVVGFVAGLGVASLAWIAARRRRGRS
ncbi:hypothetical protein [Hyperthermus butylicus]|uniref:Peptidase M1 membrane alanine aminopeptidase domain-containing protein n=1 Tax=Hyperthermus butylicus (strain DSM 5456 / JCM 9403 / PLM1-5) TaxID=415426 RepID=A2BMK3_HYPBU|nr:hypothetical protein [Hyperthermus butylicus]ABM81214.1 hypothetical protein Hbut_1390 [Hyperthermus butylicus DSM 5456]